MNETKKVVKTHDDWLEKQSFTVLADLASSDRAAMDMLRSKAHGLWEEVVFRALKRGETEKFGVELANHAVGKNWATRKENARSGRLEEVSKLVTEMAFANAKRLEEALPDRSVIAVPKSLLTSVKSPLVGTCECCQEPIYDQAHQLARTIFAVLPEVPGANAQALYDEIVDHIEEAFGDLLVLADEFDVDDVATMN
jgi:hypothetical protein